MMMRKIKFTNLVLACLIMNSTYLIGCSSSPQKGQIVVDRPEAFTRERLVSRRHGELEWLRGKLKSGEFHQSFGAHRTTKQFAGLLGSVKATIDPLQGALDAVEKNNDIHEAERKDELARLEHKKKVLQLKKDIKKLKSSDGSESTKATSEENEIEQEKTEENDPGKPDAGQGAPLVGTLSNDAETKLPDLSITDENKANLSSIDLLRDEKAYRDIVNGMISETELDDSHDLLGYGLYTLKFDSTIIPGEGEDTLAEVEIKLNESNLLDTFIVRECISSGNNDFESHSYCDPKGIHGNEQLREKVKSMMEETGYNLPSKKEIDEEIDFQKIELLEMLGVYEHWLESFEREIAEKTYILQAKRTKGELGDEEIIDIRRHTALLSQQTSNQLNNACVKYVKYSNDKEVEAKAKGSTPTCWSTIQKEMSKEIDSKNDSERTCEKSFSNKQGNSRCSSGAGMMGILSTEPIPTNAQICGALWHKYHDKVKDFAPVKIYFSKDPQNKQGMDDSCSLYIEKSINNDKWKRFAKFLEKIKELNDVHDIKPYAYSVEPKEYAQNISEMAAREEMKNFILSLKAILPQAGTNIEGYLEKLNRSQEVLHSIQRKPLAVGFLKGRTKFGWVFGPKFKIEHQEGFWSFWPFGDKEIKAAFEHTAQQHSFHASVVAPAWYPYIRITAKCFWLNKDGEPVNTESCPEFSWKSPTPNGRILEHQKPDKVNLPTDYSALTTSFMAGNETRRPLLDPSLNYVIQAAPANCKLALNQENPCETQLVIRGKELWRNPQVFVGHQEADKITIQSDMDGIVATFNKLQLPVRKPGNKSNTWDLRVVTSTGQSVRPNAVTILGRKSVTKTSTVKLVSTFVDNGDDIEISVEPSTPLERFSGAKLFVRRKRGTFADWLDLGTHSRKQIASGKAKTFFTVALPNKIFRGSNPNDVEHLEALVKVQKSPDDVYQKLGKAETIGTFVYFGKQSAKNATLVNKNLDFKIMTSGKNESITLSDKKGINLSFNKLLLDAFPDFFAALQTGVKLILNPTSNQSINQLVLDINTPSVKDSPYKNDEKILSITPEDLTSLIPDLAKISGFEDFTLEIMYGKGKKLVVHNNLKLTKK